MELARHLRHGNQGAQAPGQPQASGWKGGGAAAAGMPEGVCVRRL